MPITWRGALGACLTAAALAVPLATAPTAAAAVGTVVLNEVESSGGTPGDWVELANTGTTAADVSDYVLRDGDATNAAFTVPAQTSIPAGGVLALDVAPVFGLGAADTVTLFAPGGTTVLDTYSWTAHATTTYGRCPSGTGAFTTTAASTKGAVNACGAPVVTTPAVAWPGGSAVATADPAGVLGGNLSGLAHESSPSGDVLWAVKNGPSTLFRLVQQGGQWVPDTANGWGAGKALRYPAGTGDPDAEGVTLVDGSSAGGVYVSTERDNAVSTVSRPEVLRFDVTGTGTVLAATAEWDLTADLPAVAPNSGLEAITWVPDTALVAGGFRDQRTGAAYAPATYAGHGSGLFLTGLEADGSVRAYALDPATGSRALVATFSSGFPTGVMDLEWEPESGLLWAECDDTCGGRTATLAVDASGAFAVTATHERPAGMPNLNNEGFAITPRSACVDGLKPVFWADDANTDGHALRSGTLRCTPLDTSAPTDLRTTVTAPARVAPGAELTATVAVTNLGTTPAGRTSTAVLSVGAGGVTAAPGCAVTGPLVVCPVTGLAPGATVTHALVLRAPGGPSVGFTAAVTGSVTPDPVLLNGISAAVTTTR